MSIEDLETNDCTVRALSEAYDIPYFEAHKICERYGRKFREGFHFQAKMAIDLKMILLDQFIGQRFKKVLPYLSSKETYLFDGRH